MHQGCYFVYMMTNRVRGVLYTGAVNDMARRVVQHRTGKGTVEQEYDEQLATARRAHQAQGPDQGHHYH